MDLQHILDGYTRFKPISLDKCCSIVVISYALLMTSRMHCPIVLHGQFEFGRLHDGPVEGWSKKGIPWVQSPMTFTRMLDVAHSVVPCTNGSRFRRSTYCRCNRLPRPPSWPRGSSRYCPTWSASFGGAEGVVGGGGVRPPRPPRGRSLSLGSMTLGKERGVETRETAKERGGSCSSQRCSSPDPSHQFIQQGGRYQVVPRSGI